MEAQAFLDSLTVDPAEADNLVHVEHLPARDPKPLPFPDDLPEVLVSRLALPGVEGLFGHPGGGRAGPPGGRQGAVCAAAAGSLAHGRPAGCAPPRRAPPPRVAASWALHPASRGGMVRAAAPSPLA